MTKDFYETLDELSDLEFEFEYDKNNKLISIIFDLSSDIDSKLIKNLINEKERFIL